MKPGTKYVTCWLPVLFCLFVLSACVPTSENPAVVPGQKFFDEKLFGVWYGALEEGDEPLYWHIFRADDDDMEEGKYPMPGGMQMLMVAAPKDKDDEGGWAVLYALSTEIDGKHFLSVDYQQDSGEVVEDEMRGYHLFSYSYTSVDTFQLRMIDEDSLETLIDEGTLEGKIIGEGYSSHVRLTASSQELVTYLKTTDIDALFQEEYGTFKRQIPAKPN